MTSMSPQISQARAAPSRAVKETKGQSVRAEEKARSLEMQESEDVCAKKSETSSI